MKAKLVSVAVAAIVLLLAACVPAAAPTPTPVPASKETAKPAAAAPAASPTTAAAKPTARPLEKVKIMIPSKTSGRTEFYIGVEKGIFREEGLDAEITVLAANLAVPAMLNGDVDYITVPDPSWQAVVKGGEPIRQVMEIKGNNSWRIFVAPGLTSGKQLDGKPIAVNSRASSNQVATEQALKSIGLDPSKNTFVVTPNYADIVGAMKSGAVSGASMSSPQSYLAAAEGLKEVLDTRDVVKVPSSGLTATVKRIQQNPDQVKRVMRAIFKSIAYIKAHQEETIQWLMKDFELTRPIAEKVLEEELAFRTLDGFVDDKQLESYANLLRLEGFDGVTVEDVRKALDQTLVKEVQKDLGIAR